MEGFEIFGMDTSLAPLHWLQCFYRDILLLNPLSSSSASSPSHCASPHPQPPTSISWLPERHRAPQTAPEGEREGQKRGERASDLFSPLNPLSRFTSRPFCPSFSFSHRPRPPSSFPLHLLCSSAGLTLWKSQIMKIGPHSTGPNDSESLFVEVGQVWRNI